MLHSHSEIIELNPLVTATKPIPAPREAAADEYFAQWHEIEEIITWGFGLKKKIKFRGVFHDMPWGLQTHIYAPMGVDMRSKWQIRGNQPGEPREPRELGMDTPQEGLYLREDIEIICNIALTGFVKKEAKAATLTMVERLTRKAELLDEGVLHAMFEQGRLKTINPKQQAEEEQAAIQRQSTFDSKAPLPSPSTQGYPGSPPGSPPPKTAEFGGFGKYRDLPGRADSTHRVSSYLPAYQQEGYQGPDQHGSRPQSQVIGGAEKYQPNGPVEVEGSFYHPNQSLQPLPQRFQNATSFRAELADTSAPPPAPDNKPAYPSPLNPRASPRESPHQPASTGQPSPGLQDRQSSHHSSPNAAQDAYRNSSTGSYNASSDPNHPANRSNRVSTASYSIANPDEGYSSRQPSLRSQQSQHPDARYSQASDQRNSQIDYGLANQVQGLGIHDSHQQQQQQQQQQRYESKTADPTQFGSRGGLSKCPVCNNFEGDEAAVSHHVSKHFQ